MGSLFLATLLGAAPVDPQPNFSLLSPGEERHRGRIVRLNPDFSVVVNSGVQENTVKNVYSIRRTDRPLPPFPTGPQLITTNGDRLVGSLLGGDAQAMKFLPSGGNRRNPDTWNIPFSAIAVLWLTTTPANTPLDLSRYEWLATNRDVFRFRNGDTERGTLVGLDPDFNEPRFTFRPEQGAERVLRGEEIAAIGFNPTLGRVRKPKGPYAHVILTDSSRLNLVNPSWVDQELRGETLFGLKIRIPENEVLSLDVLQGKAIYLSDLKPKKVEQTDFLNANWIWLADRDAHGSSLRVDTGLGPSTYDKGLGVHPRSVLTYDLGGKYSRFEAEVGLDPQEAIRGRAAVRVLVDGKEQEVAGLAALKAGLACPIRLGVKGAKELTLITDFGPAGGVGADVNWCEARLVE
jgi:hypothetical protein